jgi:hypothetical protein
MSTYDANRRFAHNLFSASDGENAGDDQDQGADDGLDEQRRFAAALFAADDPDANVLAGLTDGKTAGRWRHSEPEPEDNGPWFDRRPAVDD